MALSVPIPSSRRPAPAVVATKRNTFAVPIPFLSFGAERLRICGPIQDFRLKPSNTIGRGSGAPLAREAGIRAGIGARGDSACTSLPHAKEARSSPGLFRRDSRLPVISIAGRGIGQDVVHPRRRIRSTDPMILSDRYGPPKNRFHPPGPCRVGAVQSGADTQWFACPFGCLGGSPLARVSESVPRTARGQSCCQRE